MNQAMSESGVAPAGARLRVGRVSITLEPAFFVVTGLIGLTTGTTERFVAWMLAVFASTLVHELGHAATFVAQGSDADVRLYGLGGLTTGRRSRSRAGSVAVSLSGSVAGILLLGLPAYLVREAGPPLPDFGDLVLGYVVWTSVAWSLLNLLPLVPLDGGHLARDLLEVAVGDRAEVIVPVLSMVTAGVAAVVALALGLPFLALYAAFFVAMGYSAMADVAARPVKQELRRIHQAIDDGELAEAAARADHLAPGRVRGAVRRDVAELPAWIAMARDDTAAVDAALAALPPGVTPSGYLRTARAALAGRPDEAVERALEAYKNEHAWPPDRQLARVLADCGAVQRVAGALAGAGDISDRAGAIEGLHLDLHREGRYADAVAVGALAMRLEPSPQLAYNIACSAARAGDVDAALGWLQHAVDLGFDNRSLAAADVDLADLRSHARWVDIVGRMGQG
jgi:Zn-dependent protease